LSLISQLLKEAKTSEDKLDLIMNVDHISGNLDEAIRELNDLVTRQTVLKKELKSVSFKTALDVVVASTSSLINRENAQIIADFDALNEINYIPEYLESILLNLITNAIRYKQTGRKPVIYIQTYRENGNSFLEVSDNGMGIDLAQAGDKMFGMYKTFHRHPEAKGIGLFITKNQVETMGGEISVTSTVNIGTTFKIKFWSPMKPIELACIIDDDKIYVNLVKKIIEIKKLSQNLIIFKNGKEALDYFKAILENLTEDRLPDIIFLDLNMPVMDGWEFLGEFIKIKNNFNKKITLYVVSSSIDPRDLERAKSFNMVTDYLIKPIELKKFEKIF